MCVCFIDNVQIPSTPRTNAHLSENVHLMESMEGAMGRLEVRGLKSHYGDSLSLCAIPQM